MADSDLTLSISILSHPLLCWTNIYPKITFLLFPCGLVWSVCWLVSSLFPKRLSTAHGRATTNSTITSQLLPTSSVRKPSYIVLLTLMDAEIILQEDIPKHRAPTQSGPVRIRILCGRVIGRLFGSFREHCHPRMIKSTRCDLCLGDD